MVMMPEPLFGAVEAVDPPRPLFYLSPAGRRFDQELARELAAGDGFSLLCGRYEGVDERVREHLVDGEISVGDVVLAGGEVAALVVIEAVGRLVPGVLGKVFKMIPAVVVAVLLISLVESFLILPAHLGHARGQRLPRRGLLGGLLGVQGLVARGLAAFIDRVYRPDAPRLR